MRPFGFIAPASGGGPPVDPDYPSTLAATAYLKDFSSPTWAGSASAGTSGSHQFITYGVDPSAGATFVIHPSALYATVSQASVGDGVVLSDIITAGAFSLDFVCEFASADAPAGSVYGSPSIFNTQAEYIWVTYTTDGIRFGIYDGSGFPTTTAIPLATGVKANVQVVHDGTNLKCRVNGGSYQTIAAGHVSAGGMSDTPRIDRLINDYTLARFLAFDFDVGDSVRDLLYADAQTYYGVP